MNRLDVDVAVVGAGVAGLAAAHELRRADPGLRVAVLEARDRIGGRIYTQRTDAGVPIELGAEFVHGTAAETVAIAERASLTLCEVSGDHWQARKGRLTPFPDFWKRIDLVMRRLDAERTPDRSFLEFVQSRPGGRRLAQDRALAVDFVEGFHAADAARISERALAAGGTPGPDPNELRMARVLDGYDRVPAALAETVGDAVQLNAVVSSASWRRGEVHLTVASSATREASIVRARAAIITVPLGVLLAAPGELGAIAFDPPIDRVLEHARGLTMGSAFRIVLQLRERFWENSKLPRVTRGTSLNALNFLHVRDEIGVWWTQYPLRVPVIIGWAGGPRASRLLSRSPAEIEQLVPVALAASLGISTHAMRRLVVRSWMHDWDRDPFARGAYSYALVGGNGAWRRLARPLERTLHFAGEATDPDGQLGTVNGAIATGIRAAKVCLRGLRSPRAR